MSSYQVVLPVFSGPMDLLLHLVKQQEVDIADVSISRILDRYLEHLRVLQALDLNDIGEFLVMAGTLMEIKSRELLPREAVDFEEAFDPRDDLIRRLLEYKRYRDLARKLDRMAARRSLMHSPTLTARHDRADDEDEEMLDLSNVDVWTLTAAFSRLLEQTGQDHRLHVGVDVRTVHFYTEQILDRVHGKEEVPFEELFDPAAGRVGLIGVFCALLEMMKQGYVRARQDECFGPIRIVFLGPQDLTADQVLARAEAPPPPADTAAEDDQGAEAAPPGGAN
jgi:segregation and condensation protein A